MSSENKEFTAINILEHLKMSQNYHIQPTHSFCLSKISWPMLNMSGNPYSQTYRSIDLNLIRAQKLKKRNI